MRSTLLPATLTLAALLTVPAHAQISTNDQSLEQLPAAKPAPTASRPPAHHRTVTKTAKPAAKPNHPAATATVPAAPPANPVIVPAPIRIPDHKPPSPPPVPVRADASGAATPIPGGTRIGFGAGTADLNPATLAAIQAIAAAMRADPAMTVDIAGYAPGSPDDPSTPRRLSLDRALAARAILIQAGILSSRIYALARGTDGIGAGPPDRVDLTRTPPAKAQ